MKCPKCGSDVLSTDSHCNSCGVHLATAFKEKQASNPTTSKPSPTPQTQQTGLVCPRCGHPVKSTDIACGYCTFYLGPGGIPRNTVTSDNIYGVLALLNALFGSPIIGIILGILGLIKSYEYEGKGKGISFAAIIIGILWIIALFTFAWESVLIVLREFNIRL